MQIPTHADHFAYVCRYVHWDNYDNEPAMQAYLNRLSNTSIQSVYSPITPYVPAQIGTLETFRELYRWFGPSDPGAAVAQKLGELPRGSLGYLYKLPDVGLDQVEALAKALPSHVQLVGYRELAELAKARRELLGPSENGGTEPAARTLAEGTPQGRR